MVISVDQNYINQFSDMVHDLIEQNGSKLMNIFPKEVGEKGEYHFFDRLGTVDPVVRQSRFEQLNTQNIDHSRRGAVLTDYQAVVGLSDIDKIRMLVDPQSGYARKVANGLGRRFDIDALTALVGTALTGKAGGSTQALSAGQIDTTASGLTLARMIKAKKKFVENNVSGKLFMAIDEQGLEDLLNLTEVQSADYNSIRALVNGEINTFMGMEMIQFGSGIVPEATAGSVTRAIIFTEDALKVAIGKPLEIRVDEIADRGHFIQVAGYMSFGMVRMEEELVYDLRITY